MARGIRANLFYALCRLFGFTRHERYYQQALTHTGDEKEMLAKLITHAVCHVPYYRALLADDRDWAADLEAIPVLTKDLIRENFPQLQSTEDTFATAMRTPPGDRRVPRFDSYRMTNIWIGDGRANFTSIA